MAFAMDMKRVFRVQHRKFGNGTFKFCLNIKVHFLQPNVLLPIYMPMIFCTMTSYSYNVLEAQVYGCVRMLNVEVNRSEMFTVHSPKT